MNNDIICCECSRPLVEHQSWELRLCLSNASWRIWQLRKSASNPEINRLIEKYMEKKQHDR